METKKMFIVGEIGWNWSNSEKLKLFQTDAGPLEVYIDSEGGSVTSGNSFSALLRAHAQNYNVEVRTIGVGIVASIATAILLAGTKAEMDIQCLMMIHNPTVAWFSGDAEQMRQGADTLDVIKTQLIDMYVRKIEKSGKATDKTRKQIMSYMDAETWFTAQQALDLGLIDGVQTFEAQAAEAQTIVLAMPELQQTQYSQIVNKSKTKIKQTMPEKLEDKTEKGFLAMLKSWFSNEAAEVTAPIVPIVPIVPIAVVEPKAISVSDLTIEELQALIDAKTPKVAAVVEDAKVTELTAKLAAAEHEAAMLKTKSLVNHTPAPAAILSKKDEKIQENYNRMMAIPSVKAALTNK